MKRNKLKFAVGSAAIVITLLYLAIANSEGNKLYSKTVADLKNPTEGLYKQRLTVAGTVVPGSIVREGRVVRFTIHDKNDESQLFPVEYRGKDPLPDLFRDRADVNVDGRLDREGLFVGDTVAAKCASKYEKESAAGLVIDENGRVIESPILKEN
ncbi:MAG TPA: cytochrome c maturation protein CcmE [Terriglobia bacterium]|nr:cytochrome c maturation protein CcmE [Terriglobia bacterium]